MCLYLVHGRGADYWDQLVSLFFQIPNVFTCMRFRSTRVSCSVVCVIRAYRWALQNASVDDGGINQPRGQRINIRPGCARGYNYYSVSALYRSSVLKRVCLCVRLYLFVREHISGTTRPICTSFVVHVPDNLPMRCDTSTSGFTGDVIYAHIDQK